MKVLKRYLSAFFIPLVFAGVLALTGCSSKPTQEDMTQLESVRSEIRSLEQKKSSLEQEKAALAQSVSMREAQLNRCAADQTAVKEKLQNK